MKDYRLSEIVAHCKEMGRDCNFCREYDSQTEEQKAIGRACRLFGMFPAERMEKLIEPRDMIELPSVQKNEWVYADASRNLVTYDVIYRDQYGHIQRFQDFSDEARAYAFLAELKELKGGNNGNIDETPR